MRKNESLGYETVACYAVSSSQIAFWLGVRWGYELAFVIEGKPQSCCLSSVVSLGVYYSSSVKLVQVQYWRTVGLSFRLEYYAKPKVATQ